MNLLTGKNVAVTGGASGIGAAIARRMAEEGAAKIALFDINKEQGDETAAALERCHPCSCRCLKVSVDKEADAREGFRILGEWMTGGLDVLVNNAGISGLTAMEELNIEQWDRTFDINVKGCFIFAKEAIRFMRIKKSGRIINMASQAGKIGGLIVGMDYSSSKGAVLTLTKSLAKVCAQDNITVNSVAPGLIATEMTSSYNYDPRTVPLGRIGTPDEVADAVVFLASDLSRYITGACIDVNGGMSMW